MPTNRLQSISTIRSNVLGTTLCIALLMAVVAAAQPASPMAVQVDISKLLNARVVITQRDGHLQLVDTNGLDFGHSILLTKTAAEVAGAGKLTPLPDSDLFAANDRHPEVKLHYAQAGGGPQVYRSAQKTATNTIPVPQQNYRQMQLFFISAAGPTPISVKLQYVDGSSDLRTTRVPDFYYLPKAGDQGWFVLVDDFGKVDHQGKMTEAAHHYIHGFDLNPDPGKVLQEIEIIKENSGSVLNLFGITGTPAEPKGH